MSQKHVNKNKNVVVWDADTMQNGPVSNRGVVRIVDRKSLVRTTNNPVTTQTKDSCKIASTTMRRTIAANKSVTVNESTILNTPQSGKVQPSQNRASGARAKTRAKDRPNENAINDQHMLISDPPTNIVPPKRSSRKVQVYDSTEEDQHSTASSGMPRLGSQRLHKGKEILQVDSDVDNGRYIIDAHFRENQMLVYEQQNLEEQNEVEYEDYEILDTEVLPTGQGQEETYDSDDVGRADDGAESDTVGEDDENNNSLNGSNDDYETVERNKVSTSHERQIEPINSDPVGMSGNGGRNTCCDRCKDVNGILLRKLNEIIELLNASSYKIGESNKNVDFSRLGSFPLQSVKDVENFEKQLKEDSSLMELYKMKIYRIGGDNPTLAIRSALKTIITDEVAQRYSWTGLKQTIKFSQHKIIDGIIETVMKRGDTTLTELQNTAKEWLRHAGDRVRYQQKKELKTLEK